MIVTNSITICTMELGPDDGVVISIFLLVLAVAGLVVRLSTEGDGRPRPQGTGGPAPGSGMTAAEPEGLGRAGHGLLLWGSTYLGILFAIRTFPPFLMLAARFAIAGALLFVWSDATGRPGRRPPRLEAVARRGDRRRALLLAGNGSVAWSETPHLRGRAVWTVATTPPFFAVFEAPRGATRADRGRRARRRLVGADCSPTRSARP